MQFERVHLDVFSTSRFATPAISPDWILNSNFLVFRCLDYASVHLYVFDKFSMACVTVLGLKRLGMSW